MRSVNIIRPFIATLFMLLFAVSITPQRTLHDIFGCHTDATATADEHDLQLKAYKLNCSCNQADLHTSIVEPIVIFTTQLAKPVEKLVVFNIIAIPQQRMHALALRGPPASLLS